jgi:hypothetical protein
MHTQDPKAPKKGAIDETDIPCQTSRWLSSKSARFERSIFVTSICNLRLSLKIRLLTRSKSAVILRKMGRDPRLL